MGYLEQDEVVKYRKLYTLLGVGGLIFLLGFLILVFGRTYGFDGTNYDLFMVFGVIFVLIGLAVAAYPLAMQIKILCKGLDRTDEPQQGFGYLPPPSAAGQVMRNTQIFSSAPPSSYEGGGGGGATMPQHMSQAQAQYMSQHQTGQPQFQQRGASNNPHGQMSSVAAAANMYRAGSSDQLAAGIKPAHSQSSINRTQGLPPPAYQENYQHQRHPLPPPVSTKPRLGQSSDI
ncbi:hypothetical protein BOX15_Mlig007999g1 [Macrostomum lignano]|uniref:Uncharacterized protein n=1 Tax=Macrostomum lignano TaxID=282301 RepID=A0A267GBN6_9PLAT|nr:hypothetical protein BOX15_Mlig007273g1 [Macrostomum lignano]PAA76988.1 hypothetical protein BOX15_Mlig007273g2 [Macrostomum lignano]PAA82662.1 hypothetical protein BOX15_Mlig007999g1 [Macrostomum lignano]